MQHLQFIYSFIVHFMFAKFSHDRLCAHALFVPAQGLSNITNNLENWGGIPELHPNIWWN